MNDSQWPRFQVFLQEKEGDPYRDVGSVHAPDKEIALFNARDVFVRRPQCHSLWVVPASAIYSKTAQEMALDRPDNQEPSLQSEDRTSLEPYYIFRKDKPAGTMTYVGEVIAPNPGTALHQVVFNSHGERSAYAWWVFPARLVSSTEPQDEEILFAPAHEKKFRVSTDFHVVSAMRQLRTKRPGIGNRTNLSDDHETRRRSP
jgi:ring-1,2-phenylacetyl-CoA epoxidase subunit PaaB